MIDSVLFGDCRDSLRQMAAAGIQAQTCVTSPPYFGLRDYGHDGQLGLEETPEQYIAAMVEVFRCVREVLADDATLWINIGDSYARNPSKGGSGPGGKNGAYSDSYTGANEARAQGQSAARDNEGIRTRVAPALSGEVKEKDLIGIPWMLAFALRADGWYLRQDIIWHKPNPMPESVTDRCTKAHEYVFLLSKSPRYFYDAAAVKESAKDWSRGGPGVGIKETHHYGAGNGGNAGLKGLAAKYRSKRDSSKRDDSKRAEAIPGQAAGTHRAERAESSYDLSTRNRRSVWSIATKAYKGAHFAVFPEKLVEPCILAGSRRGDIVLDPFLGSGTTAAVAVEHGRHYIGCELNRDYEPLQDERIAKARAALASPPKVKGFRKRAAPAPGQMDFFGGVA